MLFHPVRFMEDPQMRVCFCKAGIDTGIHGSNTNPIDLNTAGNYRIRLIRLCCAAYFDIETLLALPGMHVNPTYLQTFAILR